MTVDWLGPDHVEGSKPSSQAELMKLLVTDPSERSPDKFIRGHLLNENLGGPGTQQNLFPITGSANSKHLHSTETRVKAWMKKPKRWVYYQVKVTNISARLNRTNIEQNYVDCVFACHAILKEANGKVEEQFTSSIASTYKKPAEATVAEGKPKPKR